MRLLVSICNDFDSFGSAKQILALQSGKWYYQWLQQCIDLHCDQISTAAIKTAKWKKLGLHVSSIPFANSIKCFTKPKDFLACSRLFSSLWLDFFVKFFFCFQIWTVPSKNYAISIDMLQSWQNTFQWLIFSVPYTRQTETWIHASCSCLAV